MEVIITDMRTQSIDEAIYVLIWATFPSVKENDIRSFTVLGYGMWRKLTGYGS